MVSLLTLSLDDLGLMGLDDSYGSLEEAEIYFATRLFVSIWTSSSDSDKQKALWMAAACINHLTYRGSKISETQANEFPRYYGDEVVGDEVVPNEIKIATYECALALLDGVDPDLEYENLGLISQGYSAVRSTFDRNGVPEHLAAGIPSATAWRFLRPLLADGRSVTLRRVS